MNKAVNDPTANEVYMVEVVGHDGLVHHLGPFPTLADAESWIAQNTQTQCAEKTATANAALPRLSLV